MSVRGGGGVWFVGNLKMLKVNRQHYGRVSALGQPFTSVVIVCI